MARSLLIVCGLILLGPAARAAAQSATPSVEIGIDASFLAGPDLGRFAGGPRVVTNLDGRNGLEFAARLQPLSSADGLERRKTELYTAAYRRIVWRSPHLRAFTTVGGGLSRTVIRVPAQTISSSPPVVFPASAATHLVPAIAVGGGVDVDVSRRAALTFRSAAVFSDRLDGQVSAGVLVHIGTPRADVAPVDTSLAWRPLVPGQRVWVTTDDAREVSGEVIARSSSRLEVRTPTGRVSIGVNEVRAIDTTDPVRNGLMLGLKVGAIGAIGPAALATFLACALETSCTTGGLLGVNAALIGMGAGVGAVTGALVDSLRERRSPVYRRQMGRDASVGPLLGPGLAGVHGTVRW